MTATTPLDPRISEFATQEQAQAHDQWFRQKVQEALDSTQARIPHDQVMAELEHCLAQAQSPKAA